MWLYAASLMPPVILTQGDMLLVSQSQYAQKEKLEISLKAE